MSHAALLQIAKRLMRQTKSVTALLVVLAVLAVGAGAAVGNVMNGDIEASVPITVSQALVAEKPQATGFPPNRKFFSSTSDDRSKFTFAVEMFRGESLTVLLPIVNQSSGDMVAQLSVVIPDVPSMTPGVPGLTMQVVGSGQINDVVRVTPDTWTFTADGGLAGLSAVPPDGLLITFTTASTASSGFFEVTGRVRVQEF